MAPCKKKPSINGAWDSGASYHKISHLNCTASTPIKFISFPIMRVLQITELVSPAQGVSRADFDNKTPHVVKRTIFISPKSGSRMGTMMIRHAWGVTELAENYLVS